MSCVYCESEYIVKSNKEESTEQKIQIYLCNHCGRRFNERSGTPMARLRTASEVGSMAIKVRARTSIFQRV